MPWKEPGKGNKDPWQSGGDRPPDLDHVFRSVGDRFKRLLGGGKSNNGNGPSIILLLLGAVILWSIWDSPHILDESQRGVVLRFGKFVRTVEPGLQFTFPRPIESLEKVNVSAVRSKQDRGLMLTGDENLVNIGFEVQYRVSEPEKFLFNVRDPEETVLEAAESSIREVAGTNQMDFILEVGRGEIAGAARDLLQSILDLYGAGVSVTQFNLPDVKPPPQVQAAFDDVVKAREDQERFVNEAQAYANKVVPEARGRAARVTQEALGYKESVIAISEGEAQRFSLLLEEYRLAPEVTRQRLYLQTMEGVLGNSSKVLLDVNSSNNMLYLPLDQVRGTNPARLVPPVSGVLQGNGSTDSSGLIGGGRESRRGRENR